MKPVLWTGAAAVVLMIGLTAGVFYLRIVSWRNQLPARDAAVKQVEALGGFVAYDGPTGAIARPSDMLSDVLYVNLDYRTFTHDEFAAVLPLKSVRMLNVNRASVTPDMLRDACRAWPLTDLYLNECKLGDAIADAVEKESSLEIIWIKDTGMTVAGLERLCRLPRLKSVQLRKAAFDPEELKTLRAKYPRIALEE